MSAQPLEHTPDTPQPETVYSLDGENFRFDDINEALAELEVEGDLVDGHMIEAGTPTRHEASEFFRIDDLIDGLRDRAYEEAGEWADDFPDLSKDQRAELESIISNWLDRSIKVTFWTVNGAKPFEITQALIDSFNASKVSGA